MMDQLVEWQPITGLEQKYCLESISDGRKGLKILLSAYADEKKQVQIIFEDSVDSYRCTDESLRLTSLSEFHAQLGDNFYKPWTFYRVNNSAYLKWLSEQSHGIYEPEFFKHFLLLTSNEVIDIIATYEPKVELINQ